MRTDSNTVLSLSSDVPSKARKLSKSPKESGAAFEDDFVKAKEVLNPKPKSTAEDSASSRARTVANSEAPSSEPDKLSQEDSFLDHDKETVVSKNASEDDEVAAVEKDSGKVLQPEGDELPIMASSGTNVIQLDPEYDSLEVAHTSLTAQENLAPFEDQADLTSNNFDRSLIDLTGVATLDEVKQPNISGEGEVYSKSDLVELSEFLDQDVVVSLSNSTLGSPDSAALSDGLLPDDSELSWVLSQMDGTKVNTESKGRSVVTETVNTITSPDLLAAVVGKDGGADLSRSLSGVDTFSNDVSSESVDSHLIDDAVLIDEPIELRKKEQDAIIGRMSAQFDGIVGENTTGGLNSSLQNNASIRSAMGLGTSINSQQANLTMNVPPNHPGWASEMSQKVAWVARDGGHTAHIRLDPPELGSLTVKVSVDTDSNTQISFIAATPQARDLLEGQMNRLRDMLAQQGMDLSRADVDVSQQDTSGTQRDAKQNNGQNKDALVSQDDIEEDLISNNVSYVSSTGVDYYA